MNYGMALAASVVLAATTAVRDAGWSSGCACRRWERSDVLRAATTSAVPYDGVPRRRRRRPRARRRRRCSRVLGPVGLRQVDAAARGRRAGAGDARDGVAGTAPTCAGVPDAQARLRADVPGRPAVPAPRPSPATSATRCACARAPGRRRRGWRELLDLVGLAGFGDRLPATLSGGERQRVALARALAAEPRLLLLDEPLSALDAGLRERLAADLRDILRAAGTTALMVTHDHDEAFTVADRLAVMRAGRVVQQGAIAEVWRAPADPETALFLGYARVFRDEAAARSWPPPACRRRRRSPYAARRWSWTRDGAADRRRPLRAGHARADPAGRRRRRRRGGRRGGAARRAPRHRASRCARGRPRSRLARSGEPDRTAPPRLTARVSPCLRPAGRHRRRHGRRWR